MKTTLPQSEIDKAMRLVKLAKLHSHCSFDLELELQHTIAQSRDADYLLTHLEPLLLSSIQNMQSFQLQLRSIQRENPQKRS